MRQLSVKLKVTLWFLALMTVITASAVALLLFLGERIVVSATQNDLMEIVAQSRTDIEYEHGALDFDDDLKYYTDGVSLSVYDNKNRLLYGRQPTGFTPSELALEHAKMRLFGEKPNNYYVYDMRYRQDGYGDIWVRGVLAAETANTTFAALLRLAFYILPIIVAIGAAGSYFLARQALKPVRIITRTAQKISTGGDLSKRIGLNGGQDEIYALAGTFDQMFERLQAAFDKERRFTSDASHELRTPVSVITAQCEYSLENDGPDEWKTSAGVILEQARRMSGLISQLLAFSRADLGKNEINAEVIDISVLTASAGEQIRNIAADKSITVHTDIEGQLLVTGDETLVIRMLWNLLENAVEYGKEHGNIKISLKSENGFVVGSVADDGIGVAPEHIGKIWERFYRVDEARSGNHFGLGLPMVKYIAKIHGGSAGVASRPGEGSTFTFKLPQKNI